MTTGERLLEWEPIDVDGLEFRARVPGGWLVKVMENVAQRMEQGGYYQHGWDWRVALAFVPDSEHTWCPDVRPA